MKKQAYSTPQMDVVMLKQQQPLLTGSYDGPANAPEMDFGTDELNMFDTEGGVTFADEAVDFSL